MTAARLAVSRHVPVLHTPGDVIEAWIRESRNVTGSDDFRAAFNPQLVVAEDAVCQIQAVALQPPVFGWGADRLDHQVRGQFGAVVEHHRSHLLSILGRADQPAHALPGDDPATRCVRGEHAAQPRVPHRPRSIGTGSGSTTVTRPRLVSVEATSQPMNPPPTTTARTAEPTPRAATRRRRRFALRVVHALRVPSRRRGASR